MNHVIDTSLFQSICKMSATTESKHQLSVSYRTNLDA